MISALNRPDNLELNHYDSEVTPISLKEVLECEACNDWLLEAWERMTYGGVRFGNLGQEHVHREWGNDSIGVSHGYQMFIYGVDWGVTSSS